MSSRVCMYCTYWLAKNDTRRHAAGRTIQTLLFWLWLAAGRRHLNTLSEFQRARPVSCGVVLFDSRRTNHAVHISMCSKLLVGESTGSQVSLCWPEFPQLLFRKRAWGRQSLLQELIAYRCRDCCRPKFDRSLIALNRVALLGLVSRPS